MEVAVESNEAVVGTTDAKLEEAIVKATGSFPDNPFSSELLVVCCHVIRAERMRWQMSLMASRTLSRSFLRIRLQRMLYSRLSAVCLTYDTLETALTGFHLGSFLNAKTGIIMRNVRNITFTEQPLLTWQNRLQPRSSAYWSLLAVVSSCHTLSTASESDCSYIPPLLTSS